ncbi:carboxypeptidase-like regulatory domain-containing protein [Fibrella aquatilis]|uniref:Carboxypeptidase-like regulatory domain-containing protein n=1 Tax=Fibrella aquatilis TaxID=2817059 RepID=A0A939G948_9BACT|nr:carboxypeptidase-like regulatory domain-containing protein [Fibrella aquatilis]MBO0932610.1 carboxypeptidase-like regulatory domain-containing protein [Fibrella aquatilis]
MTRSTVFCLTLLMIQWQWLTFASFGQSTLTGRVADAKTGEAVAFANVYVSGTTQGTQADEFGQFRLPGISASTTLLVVSAIGYQPYRQTLTVALAATRPLTITLVPEAANLNEVAVKAKRDKTWERQLARFEDLFLGDSPNRNQCQLMNPWVIDFQTGSDGVFRAKASQPIEVENRALGYRLRYTMAEFSVSRSQIRLNGTSLFEEMPATIKNADRWSTNRQRTFTRSLRAFLAALHQRQLSQDSYTIYRMTSANFLETNVWANEKAFYTGNNVMTEKTLLKPNATPTEPTQIDLSAPIEVILTNQYITLGSQGVFNKNPASRLRALKPNVLITPDGQLQDPTSVEIVGYWAEERLADMLPTNYRPTAEALATSTDGQPQPTAFLVTNKDIFRVGETVWLSAFLTDLRSGQPAKGPQPLYLSLHDSTGAQQVQDVLFTANGRGSGYLTLPDVLPNGTYWLRAYTKAMLTTPALRFDKPLRITNQTQVRNQWPSAPPTTLQADTLHLTLATNKPTAGLRQLVTVRFRAEFLGQAMQGSFAVRVTDRDLTDVMPRNAIVRQQTTSINKPSRPVLPEVGLSYAGQVRNGTDAQPLPNATVTMLLHDSLRTVTHVVRTNSKGQLQLDSIDITGDYPLTYQVTDRKNKVVDGGLLLLTRQTPTLSYPFDPVPVWQPMPTTIRKSLYGLDGKNRFDTTQYQQLKTVTVRAKAGESGVIRLHSDPTFAVDFGDQTPNFPTIYELLIGRLPGVQVVQNGYDGYSVLIRGVTTWNNTDPLFILDGLQIDASQPGGLSFINTADVKRIEVISGANAAIYGSRGANGVIAIYTRRGVRSDDKRQLAQGITLPGYQPDRTFYQPTTAPSTATDADLRQTLYWHPDLQTGRDGWAAFSFYTSDLPGSYVICVEGYTPTGLSGRALTTLVVK